MSRNQLWTEILRIKIAVQWFYIILIFFTNATKKHVCIDISVKSVFPKPERKEIMSFLTPGWGGTEPHHGCHWSKPPSAWFYKTDLEHPREPLTESEVQRLQISTSHTVVDIDIDLLWLFHRPSWVIRYGMYWWVITVECLSSCSMSQSWSELGLCPVAR